MFVLLIVTVTHQYRDITRTDTVDRLRVRNVNGRLHLANPNHQIYQYIGREDWLHYRDEFSLEVLDWYPPSVLVVFKLDSLTLPS